MKVKCSSCEKYRSVSVTRESKKSYEKRRPLCVKCGNIKRIKTLGNHSPNWNGGEHIDSKGYVRIWSNNKKTYIKKHRYIWEKYKGEIPKGYVIHHKDGNKKNNTINNLECLGKIKHDKLNKSLLKNHWNKKNSLTENLLCVE